MKLKNFAYLLAAALYLTTAAPSPALADTIVVQRGGTYPTIQSAIEHVKTVRQQPLNASLQFTIQVQADPAAYADAFTPVSNIDIVGTSTSGTFLTSAVTISGVQSVTIRNFTFKSGFPGMAISGSSNIEITNNVFSNLGTNATAISVDSASSSVSIINDTFASNGTAINARGSVTLDNDIFYRNSTAINSGGAVTISYSYFFGNAANGIADLGFHSFPNTTTPAADPLFVSADGGDFHLQSASPAAGAGDPQYKNSFNSTSDIGAYGGPNSDILLTPITNLTSKLLGTTPETMELDWAATSIATVTGYRVYVNSNSNVAVSPLQSFIVPIGTTTRTVDNLPPAATAPDPPVLAAPAPANQALQLSWSRSPGATSYVIYFSTTSFDANSLPTSPAPIPVDVSSLGDVLHPSYKLANLVNGQTYFVAVKAVAQTTVFAGVTAVIDTTLPANPGSNNESALSNIPPGLTIGASQESGISGPLTGVPEPVVPYPNVKGEGCFIATAAYGCYSAPQVQALRDFRDRYLLTNAPGRAFVAWYYHYGPIGAHFINLHPWLKPPVRLALLPLVAGSLFLLHAPPAAKVALLLFLIVAGLWRVKIGLEKKVQRKMMLRVGGVK